MPFPDHYYLFGNQAAAVSAAADVTGPFELSSAGSMDLVSACFGVTNLGWAEFSVAPAKSSGWVSVVAQGQNDGTRRPFFVLNGPTADLLRLVSVNAFEDWGVERWDGAAWVQIGSTISDPRTSVPIRLDIRFVLDAAAGEFSVYANGGLVAQFLGDTLATADTTVDSVTCRVGHGTSTWFFKSLVIDDADTRTLIIAESVPSNNAGVLQEWSGYPTEVDERVGAAVTGSFIAAATAGLKWTQVILAAPAAVDANAVEGVVLAPLALAVAAPGLHVRPLVYKDSAAHLGPGSVQPQEGVWTPFALPLELDPSTGAAWASVAAVNAAQLGFETSATAA